MFPLWPDAYSKFTVCCSSGSREATPPHGSTEVMPQAPKTDGLGHSARASHKVANLHWSWIGLLQVFCVLVTPKNRIPLGGLWPD